MKKTLTLGELSEQSLTRQKTIEDTVTAQIASELSDLKQIIKDTVISEVQSSLNALSQELQTSQKLDVQTITELQQTLVSRIDQLLNFQPLSETLTHISTTLEKEQQALQQLSETIESRLQQQIEQTEIQLSSQIETVQTSLEQQASQVQADLVTQIDNQHGELQNWMTSQDQYLQKIGHQFLIINKLPISFSIILCCLLILSTSVNLTVLYKTEIWSNFMIAMIGIIIFILVVWGIYLAYQNIQNQED